MPTLPQHSTNGLVSAPHVVILGAGASIAMTRRNSEQSNKELPSMDDLVEVVGLSQILDDNGIDYVGKNFEVLFSELKSNDKHIELTSKIEQEIYDYFYSMQLSTSVTIYDYLIMSLTKNDVIATFNWDPFLVQALARCSRFTHNLPRLIFLHGNVGVGVCYDDSTVGHIDAICSRCSKPLEATPLLYPIGEKNYTSDPLIKNEWETLQKYLNTAYFVTIYGYSAPVSDYAAKQLMLDIWKENKSIEIAEFEIIDIKSSEDLRITWEDFIHNNHVMIADDIFKSYLFQHPRRSTTALFDATMMLRPHKDNPIPNCNSLEELHTWVKPLIGGEESEAKSEKTTYT